MLIFLEGPDGSGKSYASQYLSKRFDLPVKHTGGPPLYPDEFIKRCYEQLFSTNVIYDRCSFVSEFIYGPLLRNGSILKDRRYWFDHFNKQQLILLIYCRPSIETILSVKLLQKPHKTAFHIRKVKNKITPIIEKYDTIMGEIPHIKFDRDLMTLEELQCAVLTSPLGKKLSEK